MLLTSPLCSLGHRLLQNDLQRGGIPHPTAHEEPYLVGCKAQGSSLLQDHCGSPEDSDAVWSERDAVGCNHPQVLVGIQPGNVLQQLWAEGILCLQEPSHKLYFSLQVNIERLEDSVKICLQSKQQISAKKERTVTG